MFTKPNNISPKAARLRIGFITTVLHLILCVLIGVFTFSGTQSSLKTSTSVLKVDTRAATVDDLLGRIELKPILSVTTTPVTILRPTPITTTTTSSSTTHIPASLYTKATVNLQKVTQIMNTLDSYATVDDFSLARVLSINDHFYLGVGGFSCWSDNLNRDGLRSTKAAHNGCPTNGFLKCFGRGLSKSMYSSPAYSAINTDYLVASTSLNETIISELSNLWSTIVNAAEPSSMTLNVPDSAYSSMIRSACGNDYIVYSYQGISQNKASKPYVLGIVSLVLIALATIFQFFFYIRVFALSVSFPLFLAMFGFLINSNVNTTKAINESQGITATSVKSGSIIGYFIPMLILYLIIFALFCFQLRHLKKYHLSAWS